LILAHFPAAGRDVETNHRNSQKSTGPARLEGKAISRFNALKSGVNAKSQVIPGEDASALDALAPSKPQQKTA
jgi:hypothetical protein